MKPLSYEEALRNLLDRVDQLETRVRQLEGTPPSVNPSLYAAGTPYVARLSYTDRSELTPQAALQTKAIDFGVV